MRMASFLAAAALACGCATAADSSTEHGQRVSHEHPAKADQGAGGGIVDRTRRAFGRMGDAIRNTGNRLAGAAGTGKDAARGDTRAMGAGAEDARDPGRRQRMDNAYTRWRSQQQKDER